MNCGITAAGSYVPYARISRKCIADAWTRGAIKGERSVAGTDEDSVTMAVEAACACLKNKDREKISGLMFATLTAPYSEKSQATLMATTCDLRQDMFTTDFSLSTKASADALQLALNTVAAEGKGEILVVGSDCRKGYPKSDKEQLFGDAAAAVTIGTENIIAKFDGSASVNTEIIDVWRNNGDEFVRVGEGRFVSNEGYTHSMVYAINSVLKNTELNVDQIDKFVFVTPDLKSHTTIAKKLKINPEKLVDPLMTSVGDCGNAQVLLLLNSALCTAKAGEKILVAAYGNGADAFVFTVTDLINSAKLDSLNHYLNTKRELTSYAKFLSFRDSLELNPGEPFRTFPSNAGTWRERNSIYRYHGSRCKKCGATIFPINRVCYECGSVDEYEEVPMQERISKVFTYTIDRLAGRGDDPIVIQTVSEDADGCRHYNLMTDFDPAEVHVGMEVEYTFRKIYEGGNYINYFWKCRPVRKDS